MVKYYTSCIDIEIKNIFRKFVIKRLLYIGVIRMKNIKYLIMDVDGTLTDGKVYIGENGEIMKVFSIKDGYGINDILPKYNIIPIVITGRQSTILQRRCKELNIQKLYQGVKDKINLLQQIISVEHLSQVAYIGDDINDIECMKLIKKYGGITACPADAVRVVRDCVDYISDKNGGDGAVREFIEWICQ